MELAVSYSMRWNEARSSLKYTGGEFNLSGCAAIVWEETLISTFRELCSTTFMSLMADWCVVSLCTQEQEEDESEDDIYGNMEGVLLNMDWFE